MYVYICERSWMLCSSSCETGSLTATFAHRVVVAKLEQIRWVYVCVFDMYLYHTLVLYDTMCCCMCVFTAAYSTWYVVCCTQFRFFLQVQLVGVLSSHRLIHIYCILNTATYSQVVLQDMTLYI